MSVAPGCQGIFSNSLSQAGVQEYRGLRRLKGLRGWGRLRGVGELRGLTGGTNEPYLYCHMVRTRLGLGYMALWALKQNVG